MPSAIPSNSSFLLVLKWLCFHVFGFLPKLQVPSESYFWPLPEEIWKSAFPLLLYKLQWEDVNGLNTLCEILPEKSLTYCLHGRFCLQHFPFILELPLVKEIAPSASAEDRHLGSSMLSAEDKGFYHKTFASSTQNTG